MITIPEYVYEDDAIKFVCPSLELAREDAARMRAVLNDPSWPDVLDKMEYICIAFLTLGFDSKIVTDALVKRYDYDTVDDCLEKELPGDENLEERIYVANLIREEWCRHMRDHLEKSLKQG